MTSTSEKQAFYGQDCGTWVSFDFLSNGVGILATPNFVPLPSQNDSSYDYLNFRTGLDKINTIISSGGRAVFEILWPKLLQAALGSAIFGPTWLAAELTITYSQANELIQCFSHALKAHSTNQIIFGLLGQDLFGYNP